MMSLIAAEILKKCNKLVIITEKKKKKEQTHRYKEYMS